MQLRGDQLPLGDKRRRSRPWRITFLLSLIMAGIFLTRLVEAGQVPRPFLPTATPTRLALSYVQEAEAHFSAGNLEQAILAYGAAASRDPRDASVLAELARVQTYSSALQGIRGGRARLAEARTSIDRATEVDPDSAIAWAVRALVYDWSASAAEGPSERERYLTEAEKAATRANQLDPNNALAKAFQAEVFADLQNYARAHNLAEQAVARDPTNLDVHRVFGTVLESEGYYKLAIEEYLKAAEINPNLTFLYLSIGVNYRNLLDTEQALGYFDRAAKINEQLKIADPTPYLAIGRTYLQAGEFFIAARNLERAVSIASDSPELFGFLGIIYFKARNYETALEVLACAVDGCSPEVGRELLCDRIYGCETEEEAQQYGKEVVGLDLDSNSLEYYYTYGSVLAFYGECERAERVFRELMATYGDDPTIAEIVTEGRFICANPPSLEKPAPLETTPTTLPPGNSTNT